jgi:hypothetical protein
MGRRDTLIKNLARAIPLNYQVRHEVFLLFLAPFSWGTTQKREAAAPKASGCFMGGTCAVWVGAEPGKQKPRSCRTQELA